MKSDSTRAFFFAGAAVGLACLAAGGSRRRGKAVAAVEGSVIEPHALEPIATEPPGPRRRFRRRWTVLATVAVGALVAGAAIAAWSVSGSGSGYAKATTATLLTVGDASASTSADLYPGGTGAVKLMVTNPNGFAVRITSVSGTGAITSDKGAACNASTGVTFTNQSGLTLDLAGGATSTFTLAGAVAMSNSSDNSCQGALFTIPVSVSGVSN
jgi:hypothetical protein